MNNNSDNDYIISVTVSYIYIRIVVNNSNENDDKNSRDLSDHRNETGWSLQIMVVSGCYSDELKPALLCVVLNLR